MRAEAGSKGAIPKEESLSSPSLEVCSRIFGVDVLADFEFRIAIPEKRSIPELVLARAGHDTFPSKLTPETAVFSTETAYEDGLPHCSFYRDSKGDIFHFPRIATFHLQGNRIEYYPAEGSTPGMIEICFLGVIFSYWLESRGRIALHASAIEFEGAAVAFLAGPFSGKTSLAAAMMQRRYPLISDDVACLSSRSGKVHVSPSYPQMRMWPEQLEHFRCGGKDLVRVWPGVEKWFVPVGQEGLGSYCNQASPLRCIYLPRREETAAIDIHSLRPGEALIELVRSSFLPRTLSATGLQTERLTALKKIVSEVPLKRLIYPQGFQHLPEVCQTIERDLVETLAAPPQ